MYNFFCGFKITQFAQILHIVWETMNDSPMEIIIFYL